MGHTVSGPRALLHSGGGPRGAVALPVLDLLDPCAYDFAAGTSVGAINVPEWAAGQMGALWEDYRSVDGIGWYMRKRRPWEALWGNPGVYSMDRLRDKMVRRGTVPDHLHCPVGIGVWDLQDEKSLLLCFPGDRQGDHAAWYDARAASASIPGVSHAWQLEVADGVRHWCIDGGVWDVIPPLPDWQKYTGGIDVILCSPVERSQHRPWSALDSAAEQMAYFVEVAIDRCVAANLARLRMYARAGIPVCLYAPRWSGSVLDAQRETMSRRFDEGRWMAQHPYRVSDGSFAEAL